MIPDFTALIVAALKADTAVTPAVYGQRFPEGVALPVIRVSTLSITQATYPAPVGYTALVQVDCLADRDTAGWAIANAVQSSLDALPAQFNDTVVSKVESAGVQFVDDQGFRPPVGRWICSVMVTAREATGGT